MMHQKIEGADQVATFRDAALAFENMVSDSGDVMKLLFQLSESAGANFQFDPAALRGVWLAVKALQNEAEVQHTRFMEAHRLIPGSLPSSTESVAS